MSIQPPDLRVTRRDFIKVSAGASFGLLVSIYLEGCTPNPIPSTAQPTGVPATPMSPTLAAEVPVANAPFEANAYVQIDPDGFVTVTVHKSEMGQGIRTALAMTVAEELEADWSKVRAVQAPADASFGDQTTGGSDSTLTGFPVYRRAGATARAALIAAAARAWDVERETCFAQNGEVVHQPTGSRLTYGQLVGLVTQRDVPGNAPLKDPVEFQLIGTRVARIDGPEIITGTATYGLDVVVPGMLHAVVARCPIIGGRVASYDDSAARAIPGVISTVDLGYGIAVVAGNTWAALAGRDALAVTWDEAGNGSLSTADIRAALLADIEENPASVDRIGGVAQPFTAMYEVPFLAHMTMEPQNCTAIVSGGSVEIWAPTQNPQQAAFDVSQALGVNLNNVTIHVTQIGGGFGRRLEVDYAVEAALIAREVGAPVKVTWTREDDVQHDFYRPISIHSLAGGLDAGGMPVAWQHNIASYGRDADGITQGAATRYNIPESNSRAMIREFPVPAGAWRAVFNSQNGFVVESFMDELAEAAGKDPYELRRSLLTGRALDVLNLAAEKAGWGSPLPAGTGRGIAYWSTWGMSHAAEVAEVAVASDGSFRVNRVVCVVDCGRPVNLDGIEAQAEGGILFALAAMMQEITIENGRIQQSNFHDFPHLRIGETPQIEVHVIPSDRDPTGMGEMTGPPLTAAVANAIYAATGKRIRRLPVRAEELRA